MNESLIKKSKARAYVRVSTLKESQKDSPENQEGLIRETAGAEGTEIERVYLDRDTATTIMERNDVKQMIEDAKARQYNEIWFASLSRFSRDTLDAIALKRTLVNVLGVRLVSIEDLYDSAKEDNEMIFTVISSLNQRQSENISKSSKRGKRQSARRGNVTAAFAPYGYKKVEKDGMKSLEIVPEHAEVVRKIYDLYVNHGYGEKAITTLFNEDPEHILPSPRGKLWGITTIQKILQNETYTGYYTFSKMENTNHYEDINDLHNRRKKLVHRNRDDWEKTDMQTQEAIIPAEMFKAAQDIRLLRGGGKRGGIRNVVNVFAKMVFCKHCGSAMVTMGSIRERRRTKDTFDYRYLMCSKRRRQGEKGCENRTWVPYGDLRDSVISGVVSRLEQAVNADEFANEAAQAAEFKRRDFDKEIKAHEKVVSDNRRLLFEIRKQHLLGGIDEAQYEFEKTHYEDEIKAAEAMLGSLSKKAADHRDRGKLRDDISKALLDLSQLDATIEVKRTRLVLSKLIERIEIDVDGEVNVYSVLGQL